MLNAHNLADQNRGISVILLKIALHKNIYHILFGVKLQKCPHSARPDSGHTSLSFLSENLEYKILL